MPVPARHPCTANESSSFAVLRKSKAYYVDKTAAIRETLYDGNLVSLITRPPRFGKTLLLSTLQAFLELNYTDPSDCERPAALFRGLAVVDDTAFCDEHLGRWPVIHLALTETAASDFATSVNALSLVIADVARSFEFLLQSDRLIQSDKKYLQTLISLPALTPSRQRNVLSFSLQTLTQILSTVFDRRVVVLIDDYDAPLLAAYRHGFFDEMHEFLTRFLGSALKDNPMIEKAVMTGVLQIDLSDGCTGFNNIGSHTISDRNLSTIVGFTSDETRNVLADFGLSDTTTAVRQNYGGRFFGGEEIYCPQDVLAFCRHTAGKPCKDLRVDSTCLPDNHRPLIARFLRYADEARLALLPELLKGHNVNASVCDYLSLTKRVSPASPDLLSELYSFGYLTTTAPILNEGTAQLRIPNEAVRLCFTQTIEHFFSSRNPDFVNVGRELMQSFVLGKGAVANSIFTGMLMRYAVVHNTASESSLSRDLLLDLLTSARSQPIASHQEADNGCFDIRFAYEATDTAVIIELRESPSPAELSTTAHKAVSHIHERRHYADFQAGGISHIRLYGIACCGKYCRTVMETLSEKP